MGQAIRQISIFVLGLLVLFITQEVRSQAHMVSATQVQQAVLSSPNASTLLQNYSGAVGNLATHGWLGEALNSPVTGYSFVFHLEIYLLFAVLIALGPLVRRSKAAAERNPHPIGLAELPG